MNRGKSKNLGKRKVKAQGTRKRILEAALLLFKEHGFDAVAIEDITIKAGTSKGNFYTYFQTKSDIIIEEFRQIDDYYEEIYPLVLKYRTAKSRLRAFIDFQAKYVKEKLGYSMIAVLYANQLSYFNNKEILTSKDRPLVRIVTDIIKFGQKRNEFDSKVSAYELAFWINRCMRGLYLDWAIAKGSYDLCDEGRRFFKHFVLKGLNKSLSQK